MAESLLHGIRIVDLSDGIAAPTACMVLAEAGAEVVLVEPPGGVSTRNLAGFHTWNRSKQSVELDLTHPDAHERLTQLLNGADVVVHSYSPQRAATLGLDDATLALTHPQLIVCSVLAWPANHSAAELPVDDLLTLARLGVLHEQQGRGNDPIFVRFPLGSWGAAWLAAIGIMARLISRGRTGLVGPAHTSLVQGALVPMMMHWSRAANPTEAIRIGMPKDRMNATLFECSDGRWIHIMPPAPDNTPLMQEVWAEMGPDAVGAANATVPEHWQTHPNVGANRAAFLRRPAQQWLEDLWANDIPAQEAQGVGAILRDDQARANDYAIDVDDPKMGRIVQAGLPLTLNPPAAVRSPAPTLGQDQAHAGRDWEPLQITATAADPQASAGSDHRWPLQGLKVLDFGNFLAGPLGAMLLADLGAEVIKVEATSGDPMRGVEWAFAGCQRGKRSAAIDLKSPHSRPALEALVNWADVVHHNLRLPAARRLGLDSAALRKINPDLIFCHTSSYGPLGVRADWPGYDQMFQASCGWEQAGAGQGNPPMWHRFGFMDHQCAMSSVVATLMALFERDRHGRPSDVAASLLGAGVLTTSETFVRADGSLAPIPQLDSEQMSTSIGVRLLRCADGWVAIAAHSETHCAQLTGVLARIDAARETPESVVAQLHAVGVPCERVRLDNKIAFFDEPDNRAAGLIAEYWHPQLGQFEQPGSLWDFGDLGTRLHRAPPLLGQHTCEVLGEVGLSQREIETLLDNRTAYAASTE